MTNKIPKMVIWLLRLIPAILLLQTLYFKFSGAEESIYIFTKLGMEPWGRIGTGVLELIAAILILNPKTTGIGAVLALGLISGAIYFHFTKLGLVVLDDGGLLFGYAVTIFITCLLLAIFHLKNIRQLIKSIF